MENSRLVASTMTHRTFPLAEALERLKGAGFDKVEFCSAGDWVPHFDFANATDKSIADCAALFRSVGMQAVSLNISGDLTVAQLENGYALAKELGAHVVTYKCGNPEAGRERADQLKERAEFNSKLADLGDKYGVICSIEAPHKLSLAENTAQIDEYWSMQDERIKCTFDTAHLTYAGEDMLAVAKKYAPRVVQIHLRDAVKGNSLLRYGEGVVDFAAFVKIFRDIGYQGYYSMEYPTDSDAEAEERLKSSVEYLAKFNI